MKLYITNKNYSSWSMRPWVLMHTLELPFEEVMVSLDLRPGSAFYQTLAQLGLISKVPVLVLDDGTVVNDSLAIVETLAELYPERGIWPRHAAARARARSLCAQMHAGFGALRQHCPMNVEADLRALGPALLQAQAGVRADLEHLYALWEDALARSGGPYLFGEFCAADAFFAPVVMRLTRYGLPIPAALSPYVQTLEHNAGVRAWVQAALLERQFVPEDEPYRRSASDTPKL
ncbi:glutathione S-transferase [Roseateles sp. BYS180W]|uniref:Glutathione S-transferase n=1 Tax=Roseateles rivi TaxID=3299028 RepID=A0ABW7FWK9_9BURK